MAEYDSLLPDSPSLHPDNDLLWPDGIGPPPDLVGAATLTLTVAGVLDFVPYEIEVAATLETVVEGDATEIDAWDLAGDVTIAFTAAGDISLGNVPDDEIAGAATLVLTATGDIAEEPSAALAGGVLLEFFGLGDLSYEAPTFTPALVAVGVHP